jgi:PiT family inorganic phosphate transporter
MGHGANDAQKSAGIIFLILIATGFADASDTIPEWAVWSSYGVMGLGTLSGGWRIIDTMARKLTNINPRQGFAANAGGSIMLFTASAAGVPVSTTHTIAGAILGTGASERGAPIQWGKAAEIVVAWVLTIPATALIATAIYLVAIAIVEN